jgi:hypothetical protein
MLSQFVSEGFRAFAEQKNMVARRNWEEASATGMTMPPMAAADEEEKKEPGVAEGFATGYPIMNESLAGMLGYLVAFVISLVIVSLFGQYFWNNSVVKLVSIAKPSSSFLNILGLFIFIRLMFP